MKLNMRHWHRKNRQSLIQMKLQKKNILIKQNEAQQIKKIAIRVATWWVENYWNIKCRFIEKNILHEYFPYIYYF